MLKLHVTSRPRRYGTRVFRAAAAIVAASVIGVPVAQAAGEEVWADCNANNGLTGKYSKSQLNTALRNVPADVAEYSDCVSIIRAELSRMIRKQVPPPAILSSKKPSKAQLEKFEREVERQLEESGGDVSTDLGGTTVVPGAGRTLQSAAEPRMPGSMALALLGIALIGIAEFGSRIRGAVRGRRGTPDHPTN
jgi:hypothetical protein